MKRLTQVIVLILTFYLSFVSTSGLEEMVGYILIDATSLNDSLRGNIRDQILELRNGMTFKITSSNYIYESRPNIFVFAKFISLDDQKSYGIKNPTANLAIYKLLVGEEAISVSRIK